MADTTIDAVTQKQHQVQRKLGRCMLLLQQYERLMKAIVADHSVSGPVDQLDQIRARNTSEVQRKTLGQLVGELTDTFLIDASLEAGANVTDPSPRPDRDWCAIRFRISMEADRYAQTLRDLEQVVKTRNELVHHFIERFDLWSEQGCLDADVHLDACYGEIRANYFRLLDFAKASDAGRKRIAAFLASREGWKRD